MKTFGKTHLLLLLSLSLVFFNSCEKDEGDKASSDLIGTWTIKSSTATATVGGVDLVDYLVDVYELPEQQAKFFSDLLSAGSGTTAGTITFRSDNTYTVNMTGSDAENGTWVISSDGKTLTITEKDGTTEYKDDLIIVSMTSSQLVLSLPPESEAVDLDEDGVDDFTVDFTAEITLTK